jgi:hypothetical protein
VNVRRTFLAWACVSLWACASEKPVEEKKVVPAVSDGPVYEEPALPPAPKCVTEHVPAADCQPYEGDRVGWATIAVKPSAVIYTAKGEALGRSPLSRRKVPQGCFEIILVFEDGRCVPQKLAIEPDKVSIFRIDL